MDTSPLIWEEFERRSKQLDAEASMERFPEVRFKREYTVFRPGHFTANRIIELNDRVELPTNSIVHVFDNISHLHEEPMDIPRLEEHPLIDRESFRKYIYHIKNFNLSGPLYYEDKYIFRQSGLPAHLLKFRTQHGSRFRYPLSIEELPARREVLLIINHNPLFRARFFGRLQTFRKLTLIWTSILNTMCSLKSFHKNQYLLVPWGEEVYAKNLFIRNRDKLTISTVKYPEDPHYFLMMHLINFMWADATTSLFRQIPEDVLPQINFILSLNGKYLIFNLAEIRAMNDKNRIYYKFINLLNMLSIFGRPVDTETKQRILQDHFEESVVSPSTGENEQEYKAITPIESNVKSPDSDTKDEAETAASSATPTPQESAVEQIIEKVSTVVTPTKRVIPAAVTTRAPVEVPPLTKQDFHQKNIVTAVPKNVTKIQTTTTKEDIQTYAKDYLQEADKETIDFIEKQPQLTVPQKKRYLRLSQKYKELELDGVSLDKIILNNNDTTLEKHALDADKMGHLPDASACESSVLTFDQSYMKKSFNKHLVETMTSFRKQGVYLVDLKTKHENDRMNNFVHYTLKYEDINGKQSTVKFRLPQINRDGRLRIDGNYQILKKQRINLPIVKISDTEVSLSSNYNKTRVERNINKAHNFFSFIDSFVNSPKSTARIEFGKCATNLPLPYEYTSIADRYRSITFNKDRQAWQLWFDYRTRMDHFDGKEETLFALEKEYGTYIGRNNDAWIFMDTNCQLHAVFKSNGEDPEFPYTTLTDVLMLSIREGESVTKKQVTEWVNIKILDKMLPVIFLLGFQYGLRNTLDYMGVKYTITEARNKTIVGESSTEALSFHRTDNLDSIKKYGLCSPYDLYNRDKTLFHKISYDTYKERAKKYTQKSRITDEDILDYLDNCPKRKPTSSKSIFWSFIPSDEMPHFVIDQYELSIPLQTIKKYALGNPIIINGPRMTEVTWKEFEKTYQSLCDDAKAGATIKPDIHLRYKYIVHFAIDSKPIPFKEFKVVHTPDKIGMEDFSEELAFDQWPVLTKDSISPVWNDIIKKYKKQYGYDLSYMNFELSSVAKFNNGKNAPDIPTEQWGACHTRLKIIYINPQFRKALKFYTGRKTLSSVDEFMQYVSNLIAHELAHEIYEQHATDTFKDTIASNIRKENFDTSYLRKYKKEINTEKYQIEQFCEYLAYHIAPVNEEDTVSASGAIKYTPKSGDIAIHFSDRTLWFNRYPLEKSLIVSGLEYFDCSQYSLADFESKDIYYQLLVDRNMSTNYLKGITSFFDLFVDGMTYEVLRKMNEPTTFRDLLIRSAQLLSTTDFLPPSSKENHRIRGFEQLNAIIYNEMSRQFAAYQSRRGKANTFSINPDAIFLRVISNAALVASEGANPLQCMKESTYMTYAGVGGRSADSFVLRDRAYAADDIGIISEATVDNQKVAINAQLSMNSGITDTLGTLETKPTDELTPADVLSNTALVFPFSTMDDKFCPTEKQFSVEKFLNCENTLKSSTPQRSDEINASVMCSKK